MKRLLFIDRDGTIIKEPPVTFQIDSLEKLEFLPHAIGALSKLRNETDFGFVMVTNQDGLGTPAYPQESFDLVQDKTLLILQGEDVDFDAIHIDKHFEHENSDTRKPGIGMLKSYFDGTYDLANSFVIGDRNTDIKLAKNLGCKAIFIRNFDEPQADLMENVALVTNDWNEIYRFLKNPQRKTQHSRITKRQQLKLN